MVDLHRQKRNVALLYTVKFKPCPHRKYFDFSQLSHSGVDNIRGTPGSSGLTPGVHYCQAERLLQEQESHHVELR